MKIHSFALELLHGTDRQEEERSQIKRGPTRMLMFLKSILVV